MSDPGEEIWRFQVTTLKLVTRVTIIRTYLQDSFFGEMLRWHATVINFSQVGSNSTFSRPTTSGAPTFPPTQSDREVRGEKRV